MIRSAFLSFYRSLTRHSLYAGLNLLGLSFGIAVFIVLSLFVRFEKGYDTWVPNADRIYTVVQSTKPYADVTTLPRYYTAGYTLDAIRQAYPDLKATRLFPAFPVVTHANPVFEGKGELVDRDFFRIFDLPVLFGDPQAALDAPDGVILSERMARKIFGRTDVVGARLDLRDPLASGAPGPELPWRVMAVIKNIPDDSTLHAGIVRRLSAFQARGGQPFNWDDPGPTQTNRTYVELPSAAAGTAMLPGLTKAIGAFPTRYSKAMAALVRERVQIGFLPFKSEHLADLRLVQTLSGLSITAWLTLAIALVNYANLATARAGLRLQEVAVRSVHGASRRHVRGQLLIEAMVAAGVSLVIAFSLVEIILPVLDRIGGLSLHLDYRRDAPAFIGLSCVVLGGALLAGLYPAHVLALRPSSHVLGASRVPGRGPAGRRLREGLTLLQFAFVGAFFIVIAGFAAQVRHMETADLGFSRDNLLVTDAVMAAGARGDEVARIWRRVPGIDGIASGDVPGQYYVVGQRVARRSGFPGPTAYIWVASSSPDFFRVYRTSVLAGRPLEERDDVAALERQTGFAEGFFALRSRINGDINVSAVKALGFSSPSAAVGQDITYGLTTIHVVGVVADQQFQGPMRKMRPGVYYLSSATTHNALMLVHYTGIDEAAARQRLAAVWRRIAPDRPLVLTPMRGELDYYYHEDARNTKLFAIGGGTSALIGVIGLFGLAAFSTSTRVHEIGIRKASGASRWRIVRLLMIQFLRPVLVANLIAWPVAYLVLDGWLTQFDDRVAMSPWFFLAGSGLSLLIAAVTVAGVAVSAASLSPARALRQL